MICDCILAGRLTPNILLGMRMEDDGYEFEGIEVYTSREERV
ncbi:hypothetical protein HRbin04_00881 [archaeon HR04]|nr:hypothetical protein HRbin04_00881 [archaeon HR04]